MAIITPKFLPGEEGYVSKKERTAKKKSLEKKKSSKQKTETPLGKIRRGKFRIGKVKITPKGEKKYLIWRFSRKVGEILVRSKGTQKEKIEMKYFRLGGVGNYKHLIQDADFQKAWNRREQELLITQDKCYLCQEKLGKSAKPNLYHYNMWGLRAKLMEKAESVAEEVVEGKLTIDEGWQKFNDILESGNRNYMSLKDTALICANCARKKGLQN